MSTLLDKLQVYHQLTLRLYQLRQQVESLQRRSRVQQRKLAEHNEQIVAMRSKIQHAQAQAGELELDIKTREAALDRFRTQLNSTKTNREYSVLLREISTHKADMSRVEEQALARMGEVDSLKAQLEALQAELAAEQGRLGEAQAQSAARQAELDRQIHAVEQERRVAQSELPTEVVAQVNRVAEANEGSALAPVLQPNPKRDQYICGGCNMGVTLEQVNALQSRDQIQVCNVCQRLLYLEPSLRPSAS